MKLKIDEIKIGPRIRQEISDLSSIRESIQEIGLLQPIIVNSEKELMSGLRRLEACRQLGWTEIEVKMVDTGADRVKKLDLEYHENLGRLDLSAEDRKIYSATREELLHPSKPENWFLAWLKLLWEKIKALLGVVKKKT